MASLQCTLASKETQTSYEFRPDDAKKSAFWLDDDDDKGGAREAPAPAECRIECVPGRGAALAATSPTALPPQPFYVGGFQLVSNAKMIEVYLNDDQYLTTCRGIPSPDRDRTGAAAAAHAPLTVAPAKKYYKSVFVVPGGPRPVRNVVLRLRSLVPEDQPVARLVMLKLTARLAPSAADPNSQFPVPASEDPPHATSVPPATESLHAASPPGPAAAPSLTAAAADSSLAGRPSDPDLLQSAMAGLSLMIKGAEERVIRSTTDKVCRELMPSFASVRAQLREVSSSTANQLASIQRSLLQQQQLIESQQQALLQLAEQQLELKQLLVERHVNHPATGPQRGEEEGVSGEAEHGHGAAPASSRLDGDECAAAPADGHADDTRIDRDGADADSGRTEMGDRTAAAVPLESHPRSEPQVDGDGPRDQNPDESPDEFLLERAFPIASASDGAPASATAVDPPAPALGTAAPPAPPVGWVMGAADLMGAGAEDDPFGECAIATAPPPPPPPPPPPSPSWAP